MLANKVKISYALANYELSPPNSEEVERVNQLISWSYQVSIFRLVLGLYIGELRKTVSLTPYIIYSKYNIGYAVTPFIMYHCDSITFFTPHRLVKEWNFCTRNPLFMEI